MAASFSTLNVEGTITKWILDYGANDHVISSLS